ncbi:SRPBCC family protein [Micromonospora sp. NBC_01699]|uniref:SRPBCC family protein n=1 Tax=Micromonospora sp. NBC_01699 TaxID=2975984 RepID=UPI002E35F132|nr:SRPBCC family protein [Micromonospora sp. NBC_01699]
MRQVTLAVFAAGLPAQLAYERISDFARYEQLTSTVRQVVVHPPEPDGSVVSDWTVHFRNGLLCWSERDTFDDAARTIDFVQLTGDFEVFRGRWLVTRSADGTRIVFDAEFDLGMPSLAAILDPVAASTLRDNILVILRGLLADYDLLDEADYAPVDGPEQAAVPTAARPGEPGALVAVSRD